MSFLRTFAGENVIQLALKAALAGKCGLAALLDQFFFATTRT